MAKLEGAIAARQQEEEELRIKQEKEKEAAMRSKQKEKVSTFLSLPSSDCISCSPKV